MSINQANQSVQQPEINSTADSLDLARQLVAQLEQGNNDKAGNIIHELCEFHENDLYQEIGKLTRGLHDSLNDFGGDELLDINMNKEMSDARDSLKHVINLTEESTHQTLNAVDNSKPILTNLSERAECLQNILQSHIANPSSKSNGFGFVAAELGAYLNRVVDDVSHVNNDMNTVVMSQGNQDISGQIIQRVIKIVQEMESSLVGILQSRGSVSQEVEKDKAESSTKGCGPAVPGLANGDVMNSQSEVDDLLSTLGF